jgi:beta-lactamase regulating signal transducer with metallopeptidase domain
MTDLIRTILIMTLSGSILALLLFILKPLMRDRLPKSLQYYLWLVVLAALLIPMSRIVVLSDDAPISAAPLGSVVNQIAIPTILSPQRLQNQIAEFVPPAATEPNTMAVQPQQLPVDLIIVLVYLSGMLVTLLYYIVNYLSFTGLYRRQNKPASAEETAMLASLCACRRAPRLYRNPLAATPMLAGLFRPAIILPDCEYTDTQLHAVLLHELTHFRRKDILVRWISVLATAAHWFNPIVLCVRREIDRACELSCDEAVISDLNTEGRQNYGDTLISVAADSKIPKAVLSTTMCEEKKALKERLKA